MATRIVDHVVQSLTGHIRLQHFTPLRSILFGGGLAYAYEQRNFWHTPVILFFPSAYAGYQAYKGRDKIQAFFQPGANKNLE